MAFSSRFLFQRAQRRGWFSRDALSPRRIVTILIIVAAVLGMPRFLRWLRHDDTPPILSDPALNTGPSVSARGMEMVERDEKGQRIWQIRARDIAVSLDKRYVIATDLERGVYFRDDKPYLYLQAARVRFDQTTRDWHSPAAFTVRGPNGLTLKSRDARWNNATKTLDCPQPVVATLKGATLKTSQVVYHANTSQLRLRQAVRVQKNGSEIVGTPGIVDLKNQTVTLGGSEITIPPQAVQRVLR